MSLTVAIILLFPALLWGWIGRMCGGAPPKLPYGLDQWLFALPYLLVAFPFLLVTAGARFGKPAIVGRALTAYVSAVVGQRTGHGGSIDDGTSTKERKDEFFEFLIKPLHGRIPEKWYDRLLLAVTGMVGTIPAGAVLAFLNPLAGFLLAISGATKALGYMIGWTIYPTGSGKGIPHLNEATAIGEFLGSFFRIYALLIILEYFFSLSDLIKGGF